MLKILGRPNSLNVRKVLWLCEEMALPYALEPYGDGYRTTDTPEFRALNPNAQVPVIVDDGVVLWESNTICRYLAARHGREDLLPREPLARARVEQWMDWQLGDLNNAWRYAFMSLVRQSPAHRDPVALRASIDSWNRLLGVLDEQLRATGAWAAGPEFTLADVVIGLSVNRWLMTPMTRPALAAVARYHEALAARPGYARHGGNGIP